MGNGIKITLGGEVMPPKSDMVLRIDYVDDGSASRVFDIAAELIRAFEDLDRVLITSIDSKISTQLVLEDLEKSSVKIFLRNILKHLDDQALKKLDWKPLIGQYLVKGKHAALEWLDRDIAESDSAGIEDLTEKMRCLAEETDVRHLPDYPQLNPTRIAQPLDQLQRVKSQFKDGEKLTITLGQDEYEVDTRKTWLPSEHMREVTGERELSNETDIILVIRKPDFLGKTQWQFRHGKTSFNAHITDEEWMKEFHSGEHSLKPGDALQARARFTNLYDENGDLIKTETQIVKVQGIIHAAPSPKSLFDSRDS